MKKYCKYCLVELQPTENQSIFRVAPEFWLDCPRCLTTHHISSTSTITIEELRDIKLQKLEEHDR